MPGGGESVTLQGRVYSAAPSTAAGLRALRRSFTFRADLLHTLYSFVYLGFFGALGDTYR
eukprot:9473884-Pyramimonas_sp.AAC.2